MTVKEFEHDEFDRSSTASIGRKIIELSFKFPVILVSLKLSSYVLLSHMNQNLNFTKQEKYILIYQNHRGKVFVDETLKDDEIKMMNDRDFIKMKRRQKLNKIYESQM